MTNQRKRPPHSVNYEFFLWVIDPGRRRLRGREGVKHHLADRVFKHSKSLDFINELYISPQDKNSLYIEYKGMPPKHSTFFFSKFTRAIFFFFRIK